jgi:hypothetical protein
MTCPFISYTNNLYNIEVGLPNYTNPNDSLKHQRFKKHYIIIDHLFCTGYLTYFKQLIGVLIMKIKTLLLTATLVASQAFSYTSSASKFQTIDPIAHKEVRDTKKGSSSPHISECGGTCGGK